MEIDRDLVKNLVEQIVRQQLAGSSEAQGRIREAVPVESGRDGIFESCDDAVAAARSAYKAWQGVSQEVKARCVEEMRAVSRAEARNMAQLAAAETGLGRAEDKVKKNLLQANKTPGLEDLKPRVFTGDRGMSLVENSPFGVIVSITPTTNPVATIINNSISMLCGGNAVVFNPHPRAKGCCTKIIQLLNRAVVKGGGPNNLMTALAEPSLKSSNVLMHHKDVRCLVVTGGPGVVSAALKSGKKAIAAGPGNPPVVVDETARIKEAAKHIVAGSSFDNNVMCTCEKEVFAVESRFEALKEALVANGCYLLNQRQLDLLSKVIFPPPPVGETKLKLNADLVGQHASHIAKMIGLDLPQETRLLIAETEFEHPLVMKEQMMPVLPLVRCRSVEEAIERAVIAEGERYHTAVIHSLNIDRLSDMARVMNANIFVKNGPNFAGLGFGGEGSTTMTIAGTTGEGITTARTFTRERRCALIDHFRIL
jgi:acyl-CoA reductase-like NAD-dependent aldehyde dehydrogenase